MRKKNQSAEFIKTCIALALIELMKIKSFRDISISELCQKAGFGRTTYYRYFSRNKDDLILYISHVKWQEYKDKHPDEIKQNEGKALMTQIYKHRDFFMLLKEQNLEYIIFQMLHQEFGRQKNENEILTYGKSIFAGLFSGVVYEWLQRDCSDTPDEIEKQIQDGISFAVSQTQPAIR